MPCTAARTTQVVDVTSHYEAEQEECKRNGIEVGVPVLPAPLEKCCASLLNPLPHTPVHTRTRQPLFPHTPRAQLTPHLWLLKMMVGGIDPSYDTQDK
jgi:hypothetical protein